MIGFAGYGSERRGVPSNYRRPSGLPCLVYVNAMRPSCAKYVNTGHLRAGTLVSQVLVEEGKVKYVGLANCTADQLRRAHAVHPVTAVEVEWSLCARHNEVISLTALPFEPRRKGAECRRLPSRLVKVAISE